MTPSCGGMRRARFAEAAERLPAARQSAAAAGWPLRRADIEPGVPSSAEDNAAVALRRLADDLHSQTDWLERAWFRRPALSADPETERGLDELASPLMRLADAVRRPALRWVDAEDDTAGHDFRLAALGGWTAARAVARSRRGDGRGAADDLDTAAALESALARQMDSSGRTMAELLGTWWRPAAMLAIASARRSDALARATRASFDRFGAPGLLEGFRANVFRMATASVEDWASGRAGEEFGGDGSTTVREVPGVPIEIVVQAYQTRYWEFWTEAAHRIAPGGSPRRSADQFHAALREVAEGCDPLDAALRASLVSFQHHPESYLRWQASHAAHSAVCGLIVDRRQRGGWAADWDEAGMEARDPYGGRLILRHIGAGVVVETGGRYLDGRCVGCRYPPSP